MKLHDIHDFVSKAQNDLQNEYVRIRKRSAEDPGTAGDQGEEDWANLFKQWLPHYFHVVTKGRIITDSGYVSHQIDVLVLAPSYPKILLDKKLYLAGGVVAAFECKVTLTAAHIIEAVDTCAKFKAALPKRNGSPYKELHSGIIYGLVAHSHIWQGKNSKPIVNVEKALKDADLAHVQHPRECVDLITVADLATWEAFKLTFLSPAIFAGCPGTKKMYEPYIGSAMTGYACHAIGGGGQKEYFSPIGTLLSAMFSRLAWNFPDMRPIEEYFRKVAIAGSGQGYMRRWPIEIYSEGIRKRVHRGELSNGVPYDEWRFGF